MDHWSCAGHLGVNYARYLLFVDGDFGGHSWSCSFIFPELAWELQLTLFAVLSIVTVFVSRRYLQKNREEDGSTLSQRGKRYIGLTVVVGETIKNGVGKVRIEDTLWRARGPDTPAGEQVKIVDIDGATFKVVSVTPK